ncbi:MAG: hypothetical protein H7839_10150 [Magnetococcus sp. YQC-5]
MEDKVTIAIVSALVGSVVTFFSNYIIPVFFIERIKDRRSSLKLFYRCSAPIIHSSYLLIRRLQNIIDEKNHIALSESWQPKPHWPMTNEYFVESTIYLFGLYFAALEKFEADSMHLLSEGKNYKALFELIKNTRRALYDVSLNTDRIFDFQVYLMEQKAIGDLFLSDKNDFKVISYSEFMLSMKNEEHFIRVMSPIKKLIINISNGDNDFRMIRLSKFREELKGLHNFLAKSLHSNVYNINEAIRLDGESRKRG